jgi:hypothetical protein
MVIYVCPPASRGLSCTPIRLLFMRRVDGSTETSAPLSLVICQHSGGFAGAVGTQHKDLSRETSAIPV